MNKKDEAIIKSFKEAILKESLVEKYKESSPLVVLDFPLNSTKKELDIISTYLEELGGEVDDSSEDLKINLVLKLNSENFIFGFRKLNFKILQILMMYSDRAFFLDKEEEGEEEGESNYTEGEGTGVGVEDKGDSTFVPGTEGLFVDLLRNQKEILGIFLWD